MEAVVSIDAADRTEESWDDDPWDDDAGDDDLAGARPRRRRRVARPLPRFLRRDEPVDDQPDEDDPVVDQPDDQLDDDRLDDDDEPDEPDEPVAELTDDIARLDLDDALASLREVLAHPDADRVLTSASRCRVEGAVAVLASLVEGSPWPRWAEPIEDRADARDSSPAEVVQRVLELRRDGLDNASIAKVLEELGVPALRGERWTAGGVKWALLSERRARATAPASSRPPRRR